MDDKTLCQLAQKFSPPEYALGPWYLIINNKRGQTLLRDKAAPDVGKLCRVCDEPVLSSHQKYFKLTSVENHWRGAVIHLYCASLVEELSPDLHLVLISDP